MKKTDSIKTRLNDHRDMLEKLSALKLELEYVYETCRGLNLSGMPGGGGYKGTSEPEMLLAQKEKLEKKVNQKQAEVDQDWSELEPLVENLKPIGTLIMNIRYRDGADWEDVCRVIFGKRGDYYTEIDRYMDRMYKAHGSALLELAEMFAHIP